jgi:hypothetical protein
VATTIITSLNGINLREQISSVPGAKVCDASEYEGLKRMGVTKMFEGEKLYFAPAHLMLSRRWECIISAIDGLIWKIKLICFADDGEFNFETTNAAKTMLEAEMGMADDFDIVGGFTLMTWEAEAGNVILEMGGLHNSIILTSSVVRGAKPPGLFARLTGKKWQPPF